MSQLALCAIGRDRPGVVAAVTEALLADGVNIEDAQAAVLKGHFALVFVLRAPPGTDVAAVRARLEEVGRLAGLEGLLLSETHPDQLGPPVATHLVTAAGVDRPGIVHAISRALADQGLTIVEMRSQVTDGERPMYEMSLEVAGEPDTEALEALAAAEGVEISVSAL
jgi:glycine cleavage system transcriptional repressor